MPKWTVDDIADQSGRTFVVTGANSGLGFQTALGLARRGARVVLAVRDLQKGRRAAERIGERAPGATTETRPLDLADLDSVRSFAAGIDEPVDVLVNNAGVMALPRRETAQGFEMQLGTNHLGHFALTGLLLDRLLESAAPRVVTLSSGLHHRGRIDFDDLQGRESYGRWTAYGQSKLANLLFALELQRRADAAGSPLRSLAAHPGYAATNLQFQRAEMTGSRLDRLFNRVANALFAQSESSGALPALWAATEDLPGGTYAGPQGLGGSRGDPGLATPSRRARDPELAARLWRVSEELTGVSYGALDRQTT